MRFIHFFLFVVILFGGPLNAQDRLALGSWRSHLACNSATTLAKFGGTIWAGSPYSMFSYETTTSALKSLSKVEGFSRSDISKIGYSQATNTVVIGYLNGQMDLVKGETIYKVDDIFNATVSGSKKINHLLFVGDKVWISTDFGLVVYNLTKNEVSEVYSNFTSTTSQVQVYSSSNFSDSIFVATSSGVYAAAVNSSINKLDYRNWRYSNPPNLLTSGQITFLQSYSGYLFMAGQAYLFKYNNGVFGIDFLLPNYGFFNLVVSSGKLWFLTPDIISSYDGSQVVPEIQSPEIKQPMDLVQNADGSTWIADNILGLVEKRAGMPATTIKPNGPLMNSAFRLSKFQDKVVAVSGAFDFNYATVGKEGAFSIYDKGLWKNFSGSIGNFLPCWDVISYVYNPYNNKAFVGAFGWGVVEWDGQSSNYKLWNNTNSPLNICNVGDFCLTGKYCKVEGTEIDNKGKLWVINHQDNYDNNTPGTLFSYDLNGVWTPIKWRGWDLWGEINYSSLEQKKDLVTFNRLFIDKNNTKWMISRLGGILAYNESYTPNPRYLTYTKGLNEEICGANVYSLATDLDGAVWIGTDNGVCYISDAKQLFQVRNLKAALPVYQNRALMAGKKVTALEVDGGNRKWIGTEAYGAWLFSSDGSTLISHFDQDNSPLPSNLIVDIKINDKTGEVFIATDRGIFSYLSDATLGGDENTDVMAYPNPVTSDFSGLVAISGLVKDANVKITDISGQLVYQTKAQGSLASWNLKDYTGRRVQPGIYIVFTAKEDGSEALATKIAIID